MPTTEEISSWLSELTDPEIPVLTLYDLGIIRDIQLHHETVEVIITPTYNSCPAMDMIATQIRMCLIEHGITNLRITHALSPAWTTDWMTESGKEKLRVYGIAAPEKRFSEPIDGVPCPHCGSEHTRLLSAFGSTACKAVYQCQDCKEPFDYFKCH